MSLLRNLPEFPSKGEDNEVLRAAAAQMKTDVFSTRYLQLNGRTSLYSIIATGMPAGALQEVVRGCKEIHGALESLIHGFVAEHRQGFLNGPLHRAYTPYYRWWDYASSEQRKLRPINVMRFDTIVEETGQWSLIENNTTCPAGTTVYAYVRQAWMRTKIAAAELVGREVIEHTINDLDGFVLTLDQLLMETGNSGGIALLHYRKINTNELDNLKERFDLLKERGLITAKDILIGDIRDLDCDGARAYLNGTQIGLIYCKLSLTTVDIDDQGIRGWLDTLRSPDVEQVNSLGAMFLTEAKRSIVCLLDNYIQKALNLSASQIAAINKLYAPTWIASDQLALDPRNLAKENFVLKADLNTRGQAVFVATPATTQTEWDERIRQTIRHHGVVQERRDMPKRIVPAFSDDDDGATGRQPTTSLEHHDVNLFFFRGEFAGPIARSHTDQVVNVGNGGRIVPVVVWKGDT